MLFCVLGTLRATHLTEGARPATHNFPESLKLAPPLPGREPIASSPLSELSTTKNPVVAASLPLPLDLFLFTELSPTERLFLHCQKSLIKFPVVLRSDNDRSLPFFCFSDLGCS